MDISTLPKSIFHKGKEYYLSVQYGRYGEEWFLCYNFYWEYDKPTSIHECYHKDLTECIRQLKSLINPVQIEANNS